MVHETGLFPRTSHEMSSYSLSIRRPNLASKAPIVKSETIMTREPLSNDGLRPHWSTYRIAGRVNTTLMMYWMAEVRKGDPIFAASMTSISNKQKLMLPFLKVLTNYVVHENIHPRELTPHLDTHTELNIISSGYRIDLSWKTYHDTSKHLWLHQLLEARYSLFPLEPKSLFYFLIFSEDLGMVHISMSMELGHNTDSFFPTILDAISITCFCLS